jgi:hypothetical protein
MGDLLRRKQPLQVAVAVTLHRLPDRGHRVAILQPRALKPNLRNVRLGRAEPPAFLHHPLMRKPGGEKLSKASRDTAIRDLRARGAIPEELFGRVLAGLGVLPAPRPISLPEATGLVLQP